MSTVVSTFVFMPNKEKAQQMATVLGEPGDNNLEHVFKKAFGRLGVAQMDRVYAATLEALFSGSFRRDDPITARTPVGTFMDVLKRGPFTTRADLRAIGVKAPRDKM